MQDITKIDTNFAIQTTIQKPDIRFYSAESAPFLIHGVFKENGRFRRMPEEIARTVSEGVYALHANTAGGRVRFATDSPYIAIHAKMDGMCRMPHFAFTGAAGFDLYADGQYVNTFVPPLAMEDGYESIFEFPAAAAREITVHFPLYSNVKELYIGLREGAVIKEAAPYAADKPIVYYGSSITQGGCASRPGMSYQAIIARRLNRDFWNLGFSGSAKAEDAMAAYVKDLAMSLFVYDYDYNAPTAEHLRDTHEKMFRTIRKAQPDLPVIMLSRPKHSLTPSDEERRAIIKTTYQNARDAGDENVYFLDGPSLTALCENDGTVDGCHPTDFGFASMAKVLGDFIENLHSCGST